MEQLRKQNSAVIYGTILMCSSAYYFLYFGYPGFSALADKFSFFGVTWAAIPIAVVFLYENLFWKIFNPRLNFNGTWEFTEDQHSEHGELDYSAHGSLKVEQNTRRIQIVEGVTYQSNANGERDRKVASWWSIGCSLNEKTGEISFALDHQPHSDRKGGAIKYGVEIMSVSARNNWGRPTRLSSKVYHCVGWGEPRIATAEYARK